MNEIFNHFNAGSMDEQSFIIPLILLAVFIVIGLIAYNAGNSAGTTEKVRVNRWDIAWGIAYGTLITVPILTLLFWIAAFFGLGVLGAFGG